MEDKKVTKNMNQVRQGDVFLTRVDATEAEGMEKQAPEDGLHTLAHGEVTGHRHALDAGNAELMKAELTSLLRVKVDESPLRHGDPTKAWEGDHGTLVLPKGYYKVTIDREYVPEGYRLVAD